MSHSKKQQNFWITPLFLLTYIVLCGSVIIFPYKIYDSDSSAYSYIAQKLSFLPIREWCAPEWWEHGSNIGLFQDHPPGVLWVTALFIRAGVPGPSAAFCANFLYIFLCLYFLYRLTSYFGGSALGWGAVFAYIFTPIFLQYLIRANHEVPLNLAIIASIYGLARSEESWRYKALFIISLVFAVFVKGISALVLAMLAFLYWIMFFRKRHTLLLIIIASFFTLAVMFLFEIWYRNTTYGVGFWLNYLSLQGGGAIGAGFNPLQKIYNIIWYLGRAILFPLPWVLFVLYGFYPSKKEKFDLRRDKFFQFCIGSSILIILFFSLFDRKADRYIFPAYCFLMLAGVWILLRLKSSFLHFLEKRKKLLPLCLCAVLIIFTLIRIYVHSSHYRFIQF